MGDGDRGPSRVVVIYSSGKLLHNRLGFQGEFLVKIFISMNPDEIACNGREELKMVGFICGNMKSSNWV